MKDLTDYFCQYIYLDRLAAPEALFGAIEDGVGSLHWRSEGFGYADAYDEEQERYLGLVGGQTGIAVRCDDRAVVVVADVAAAQQPAPPAAGEAHAQGGGPDGGLWSGGNGGGGVAPPEPAQRALIFSATASVDPARTARDVGRITENIIQHLSGLVGAKVDVVLDITARLPPDTPDHVVRTVTENCRTLKIQFSMDREA